MAQAPISASKLDRRIDVERKTLELNSFGEPTETWTKIAANTPASAFPVSGDERFAASQFIGKRVMEFRVRPSVPQPSVLDRVIYPPVEEESPATEPPAYQIFDIQDVREIGRGKGWQIFAVARSETQEFEFEEEVSESPEPEPEPEPELFSTSGTFTAGTTGAGFTGFNQEPWVTSHDWDTGSAYGTPPEQATPALVIVDSSGQCLVVLIGPGFKFPGGINLTVSGPGVNDTQYLDFWAGGQANESWHGYGYVYGQNSDPMGFQSGETYSFTIEEVAA